MVLRVYVHSAESDRRVNIFVSSYQCSTPKPNGRNPANINAAEPPRCRVIVFYVFHQKNIAYTMHHMYVII